MQICLHMYTTPKTLLNSLDLQHKAYMIWQLGPINLYHILIWFTYNRDYILICKYKQTHSIDFSSAPENACTEVLTTKSETIPKVSSSYEYSKKYPDTISRCIKSSICCRYLVIHVTSVWYICEYVIRKQYSIRSLSGPFSYPEIDQRTSNLSYTLTSKDVRRRMLNCNQKLFAYMIIYRALMLMLVTKQIQTATGQTVYQTPIQNLRENTTCAPGLQ